MYFESESEELYVHVPYLQMKVWRVIYRCTVLLCYVLFRWDMVWGLKLFLCLVVLGLCGAGQRATVQRESWVWRVQSNFLGPFPHSGGVKFLEAWQRGTDNPLSSPDCPLLSSDVCFGSWAKPNSYRWTQDRLDDGRVELISSSCGRTSLKNTASAGPLSMWLSHFRSWEMVVPRNLNAEWGEQGGSSWSPLSSSQFWECLAPGC